jgi:hypothetical protein
MQSVIYSDRNGGHMGATEEIIAKLENTAGADKTSASPTEVEKQEVAASADDKTESGKGKGASDRIQELVARAKAAETKFEEAMTKLQAKEAETSKLIAIAESNQEASGVIDRINELHKNPAYKDLIEKLDRALQGKDVEAAKVEAVGSNTPPPAATDNAELKAIRAELQATRQQAAAAIQDQKQDLLLQKSDVILKELFGQLPTTDYLAKDRQLIQEMLVERIDWDGIEANPGALESKVATGFQKALEDYGDPRGRIAAQAANKTTPTGEPATNIDLSKQDWGKLVTEQRGNKTVQRPAVNDDEFSAVLAAELRRSRGQ